MNSERKQLKRKVIICNECSCMISETSNTANHIYKKEVNFQYLYKKKNRKTPLISSNTANHIYKKDVNFQYLYKKKTEGHL